MGEPLLELRALHRGGDLHAAHLVAGHQVRGGDVDLPQVAVAKGVDAGVLQEAAHDAGDGDVVGLAGNAGHQAADAAHDEVDAHAGLRGLRQLVDELALGHGVDLHDDVAAPAAGDLAVDEAQELVLHGKGRDQELAVRPVQVPDEHVLEEGHGVRADDRVRGQEAEVRVERGGLFVEVAGADVRHVAQAVLLLARDEAELGVALVLVRAVENAAAGFLQRARPFDVVLLVKAGAQLHQDRDVLAVFRRRAQVLDHGGIARQAVDGDLDRDHLRVRGGFLEQVQEGLHALIGIEEQHVALANLVPHGHVGVEIGGVFRLVGWIVELRHAAQVVGVAERERAGTQEGLLLAQVEHLLQQLLQVAGLALHLQADRRQVVALAQELDHVLAEVRRVLVKLLLVVADVRVARDGDDGLLLDGVDLEDLAKVRQQHALRADKARLAAGQEQDGRHRVRHAHDAQERAVAVAQERGGVQGLVLQVRKGMVAVDDLRGEQGADLLLVIGLDVRLVLALQLLIGDVPHVVEAQLRHDLGKDRVAQADERAHGLVDHVQLLGGGFAALVVLRVRRHDGEVEQAPHADHEELVQVAGEDGDKAQPLHQGHRGVGGLLQHALVEFQPAQLAVLGVAQIVALSSL